MRRPGVVILSAAMALMIGACGDPNGVSFAPEGGESTTSVAAAELTDSIPMQYGDDEILDRAWDLCAQGNLQACDELWWNSPPGSEYAVFGDTCANTKPAGEWCSVEEQPVAVIPEPGDLTEAPIALDDPAAVPAGPNLDAPKPSAPGGFVPPAGAGVPAVGNSGIGAIPGGLPAANPPAGNPGGGMGALIGPVTYGDDPVLDALWDSCQAGDWTACDQLFTDAAADTHYQAWGFTCGNRIAHSNGNCAASGAAAVPNPGDPRDYGDNPYFDNLWDACSVGNSRENWELCDRLYNETPRNTNYSNHGGTCANQRSIAGAGTPCFDRMLNQYGDNPHFDALWDRCAQHEWTACDQIHSAAPPNSSYWRFGDSCGGVAAGTNRYAKNDGETCQASLGNAHTYGDSALFDWLYDNCLDATRDEFGEFCDRLYTLAPVGSNYEQVGGSCGIRVDGFGTCQAQFDSSQLTSWMRACDTGSWSLCDRLWQEAPVDSYYEWFGLTCGGMSVPPSGTCTDR